MQRPWCELARRPRGSAPVLAQFTAWNLLALVAGEFHSGSTHSCLFARDDGNE